MNITGGSTDVTTYFVLRTASDGTATTGAAITNIDLQYVRTGAAPVAKVDAIALVATDSAHADNKAIEIDATDAPGLYRVDWPDAAFAAGAKQVILSVKLASSFTEHMAVEIDPPVNVTKISDDATAANNCELMFDGTGYIGGSARLKVDTVLMDTSGVSAVINAACDSSIEDYRLDEIIQSGAAAPVAQSFFAELLEDFGGVFRFTSAALERGSGILLNTTIASVSDQTHFVLTAGSDQNDVYNNQAIAMYDASNNYYPSIRVVEDYVGASKTVTLDSAPDFTIASTDPVKVYITAPGTVAPTAAQVADAVHDEVRSEHTAAGTFGQGSASVQGNVTGNVGGNVTGTVGSLAAQAKLDVNAEVDTALNTAIPGSPTTDSVNEVLQFLNNVIEGDTLINTATTPWRLRINKKGTSTELVEKHLYQSDDAQVLATTHIVTQQLETAK